MIFLNIFVRTGNIDLITFDFLKINSVKVPKIKINKKIQNTKQYLNENEVYCIKVQEKS